MGKRMVLVAGLVALLVPLAAGCGGGTKAESEGPVTVTQTVAVTTEAETQPADTGAAPVDTGAVPGPVDAGDLVLQYIPPTNPDLQPYMDFLEGSGLMEGIIQGVNDSIALPRDLIVSVEETGGDPSPYYTPDAQAIVFPPEWLAFSDQIISGSGLVSTAEDAQNMILASSAFVFFHELGHLLIDQLGIPVTGKEEDAVDQLATVIVAEAGTETANVGLAGAVFFGLLSANRQDFQTADFWDEHSLNEQRFYNIVCWVYGSNPAEFADEAAQAGLGEDRLVRCPDEYAQIAAAWETLLAPYLKA